jgi:hypothetical protein
MRSVWAVVALILLLARYVVKGLSGERKALIERYTIDADEALHREGIAEEAAREEASRTATHDPAGTWSRFAAPLVEPLLKLRRPAIRLVPSRYPLGALAAEDVQLRCANCRREGLLDEDGWTLELCGDNQLHPFCRDCYERFGRVA